MRLLIGPPRYLRLGIAAFGSVEVYPFTPLFLKAMEPIGLGPSMKLRKVKNEVLHSKKGQGGIYLIKKSEKGVTVAIFASESNN